MYLSKSLRLLALVGTLAPVIGHAEDTNALLELSKTERSVHSRTCGLALLSDGRAQARHAKSAPGDSASAQASMSQLTRAFFLLGDGAAVRADAKPRALFNDLAPAWKVSADVVAHCERWFDERKVAPDFDASEAMQWSAVQQAELTFRTE